MNRQPPATIVDLRTDGVRRKDLRDRGDRAVYAAVLSTALSVQQRGWTEPDWVAWLLAADSTLGRQFGLRGGLKPRGARQIREALAKVWRVAALRIAESPPGCTRTDVSAAIAATRATAGDAELDLDDDERLVLTYAAEVAERNRTDRPSLPRRAVMTATGLSERRVQRVLRRLDERGLLVLAVRGRASAEPGLRRANLYRLRPPAVSVPASGSVGQVAQIYGAGDVDLVGAPAQIYGAGMARTSDRTVAVTVRAADPAALAEVLRMLAGHDVEIEQSNDATVIPFPRSAT